MVEVQGQEKKKRKRKKLDVPKTKKKKKTVKKLSDLNADEFMSSIGMESNSETEGKDMTEELPVMTKKKKKKKVLKPAKRETTIQEAGEDTETKSQTAENIPNSSNVKEGLSRLQEKDSEFFKFLQENDPELLNFGGDNASDSDDSSQEEDPDSEKHEEDATAIEEGDVAQDEEMVVEEEIEAPAASTSITVTPALLRKWEDNIEKRKSVPTWKQLVKAFHAAVITAKGDDIDPGMKYTITDPDTVNKVMMLCLERSTEVLVHHLGNTPTASPKWGNVKMSLKSYLSNLTELLGLLTSNDVLCAVMRHCKTLLSYYAAFSSHLKKLLRGLITVWGSKAELSRVVAFTTIQALVVKLPTFLEDILKKMYTEYTRCSKMMNAKTRDNIILMRNSLVELFKINPSVTYVTGFLYIRQLAITLRSVIISKKEVESVYNWQYINCLHLWVSVLEDCDACLQPLIFPLIQIMLGVVKLHSSPCFFPLQLHTIRLLLHLAASTNKHIPLIHPLLGVLDFCATINKAPATKPIDLTCVLRVTKGYKKTKAYQDGVFDLTYEMLLNYVSQLSQTIAFPEVSFPVTVWLKKFNKKCNNGKYTSQIKIVLEKMAEVSRDITERRAGVTFTPKDLEQVTAWEEELPESALTKYFNNWLRIHRTVQAKQAAENKMAEEEEGKEDEVEAEETADEEPEIENDEEPKPKKAKYKSGKSKAVDDSTISDDNKPKKKRKKKKEMSSSTPEAKDVADPGDLVEDIVLSD